MSLFYPSPPDVCRVDDEPYYAEERKSREIHCQGQHIVAVYRDVEQISTIDQRTRMKQGPQNGGQSFDW